jgi:DNA-binding NarL/FixJ family response regulator
MTRVVIADDQELVRAGFRLILERNGVEVVGEAADGVAAVTVTRERAPDVVLMDVRMPRMDGIEATRRVVALPDCATRVLMLTTFDLDEYVFSAVKAGASGFLLKDVAPDDLVHAVRVVARGDAMLAPALTQRLLEEYVGRPRAGAAPDVLARLGERQVAVVRLVARGMSNAEIAAELYLSEATVKTYVSRVLATLGLRDRVQLAVLAYETGLVRPGEGQGSDASAPGGAGTRRP